MEIEFDDSDVAFVKSLTNRTSNANLQEILDHCSSRCGISPFPSPEVEVNADAQYIRAQFDQILIIQPPQNALDFLYFGIYEVSMRGRPDQVRFYVSGGNLGDNQAHFSRKHLTYVPQNPNVHSMLLDFCENIVQQIPKCHGFLDYFLKLSLAVLLIKVAFPKPTSRLFVGFDSGSRFEVC